MALAQMKTVTPKPGGPVVVRFQFQGKTAPQQPPPQPSPQPQKHPEIDALIESGHRKNLDDDLPGAYTAYSNAESLSMGSDKYRLQDAETGKKNVLADCRDRGISCFAKP